ncbi:MAG: hypothetical protein H8E37_02245, partial [Planctomycetes bacterium]|nr:hypothetical protein [Planctomycetota bacterium]
MTLGLTNLLPLLAQEAAEGAGTFRAIEYDLPQSPMMWLVSIGGLVIFVGIILYTYIRDTRELNLFWKAWLLLLRLGAIAGILAIAINPQERTQKLAFRPSQVAVLIDRSLSMQFPEKQPVGVQLSGDAAAADASNDGRTRAEAVEELVAASGMIKELRKNHTVNVYTFDSKLNGPHATFRSLDPRVAKIAAAQAKPEDGEAEPDARVDWPEIVRPVGLETRLGESLTDLIRQISDRSLSGIVVVSDGGSNAGIDPESAVELARAAKTRLMTVGTGSTEQPVNLQVASLQAPSDVHIGDTFELAAFIQGQGFAGRRAKVELLSKPEDVDGSPTQIASREVTLGEDGVPIRVPFEELPQQAGNYEYFVRVSATTSTLELSDDDNERRKSVNVVDRKTRVLLLAGGPMRDYRFVRDMLYRHNAVQADVWLQSSDAAGAVSQEANQILISFPDKKEDLYEYDVILAFDPDWELLSEEQLELLSEWVFSQAGGIVMVAGDVYMPDTASARKLEKLRELIPVVPNSFTIDLGPDRAMKTASPFDFTREGREAGFLQLSDDPIESANTWREFTGVYSCYPTSGAKAGATVYAHFSDPLQTTSYGQPILLASQYYGAGRVLYLGSPEMWRLRAIDEEFYERFWTRSIREVGQARLKRGNNRGTIILERNQYVLGQTVRVRAQLVDPQFNPLTAESIEVEVYDPQGRPKIPPLKMLRDKTREGQYVGNFRVSTAGTWKVDVPVPQSREMLTEKIDVVLPN